MIKCKIFHIADYYNDSIRSEVEQDISQTISNSSWFDWKMQDSQYGTTITILYEAATQDEDIISHLH